MNSIGYAQPAKPQTGAIDGVLFLFKGDENAISLIA